MLSRIEQKILRKIRVPSENNPLLPEFPPEDPQFPATPTYKIKVPGFSNVWLKDESVNPTGTHKDRMAWEIVVTYRNFLLAKKRGQVREPLPAMSVISSGSAAIAIQTQLHHYGLPELRVLADKRLDAFWVRAMKKTGCKLYFTDLTKKALGSKDILALTQNTKGFDITSGAALDPSTRFYDWMSYEVVNQSPDYCFIPFGTGHLYENVLNVNKREISARPHDPRFIGNVHKLAHCHFLGATTNNRKSKAFKLYAEHSPFTQFDEQWIQLYRRAGFCGQKSDVRHVEERYFEQALDLAHVQGVETEHAGIAGLALLLQMREQIPKNAKILIVNTGKTKV